MFNVFFDMNLLNSSSLYLNELEKMNNTGTSAIRALYQYVIENVSMHDAIFLIKSGSV